MDRGCCSAPRRLLTASKMNRLLHSMSGSARHMDWRSAAPRRRRKPHPPFAFCKTTPRKARTHWSIFATCCSIPASFCTSIESGAGFQPAVIQVAGETPAPRAMMSTLYLSRRDMLRRAGAGFGSLALTSLLAKDGLLGATPSLTSDPPSSTRPPHVRPKAKSVIFLFMEGGPSHIDTFDPKPELNKLAGQQLPKSYKPVILPMGENDAPLMGSQRKFTQHGE